MHALYIFQRKFCCWKSPTWFPKLFHCVNQEALHSLITLLRETQIFWPKLSGLDLWHICSVVLILCNTLDCSLPGSFVHGIFQARIRKWVAMPSSRGSSWPKDWTQFSCIASRFFTVRATAAAAKSLQLCPTLCDPTDSCPPDFPIPGILQARILEWVAISSPMHESEKWKWSRSVVSDS